VIGWTAPPRVHGQFVKTARGAHVDARLAIYFLFRLYIPFFLSFIFSILLPSSLLTLPLPHRAAWLPLRCVQLRFRLIPRRCATPSFTFALIGRILYSLITEALLCQLPLNHAFAEFNSLNLK